MPMQAFHSVGAELLKVMVAFGRPSPAAVMSSAAIAPSAVLVCRRISAVLPSIEPAVKSAGCADVVAPANTRSPAGIQTPEPVVTPLPAPPLHAAETKAMNGAMPEYSAMDARSGPDMPVSLTVVTPGFALGRYQIEAKRLDAASFQAPLRLSPTEGLPWA